MLRWYLASVVFLLIVSPGIGYGVYRYVMDHPAQPGSMIGRVYEKSVKSKLSILCSRTLGDYLKSGGTGTQAQSDATCACFVDDMFLKLRDVPPGQLDSVAQQADTRRTAEMIIKKCAYQTGLN